MVRHPGGELVRVHFYGDGCLPFVLDDFDQFKRALLPTIEGVGDVSLKETPEGFKVFLADNGDGLVCGAAVRERPAEATRVIRDMEERDAPGKITYVDQWGRLWAP